MKKLPHKIFLLCILIVLSYLLPSISLWIHKHASSNPSSELSQKLDTIILQNLEKIPVPNLSIAVQTPNEDFSLHYGINSKPFALGSTSKSITASTLLYLMESKNISLDDKVSDFLPSVTDKQIRIIDLLNHTGGISTYDTDFYRGEYGKFEYANENYNLLGDLISALSGQPYERTVQEIIFSPLQMNDSFAINKDNAEKLMEGYQSYFGLLLPQKTDTPTEKSWIAAPSGKIASTSSDAIKYLQWISKKNFPEGNLLNFIKQYGVSVKNEPAMEGVFQKEGIYCCGWIQKSIRDIHIIYHTGKLSNFNSIFVIIPDLDIKIVVLCNVGDFTVAANQLENMYEQVISATILQQSKSFDTPTKDSFGKKPEYVYAHFVINIILMTWLLLCINARVFLKKLKSRRLYKIFSLIVYGWIPTMSLLIFPLMKIPYFVIRDFAPDLFSGIIIGCIILFFSGLYSLKNIQKAL